MKIKILHILSSLDSGGVEKMLWNYYSNIDREKYKFDFIVHGEKIGILEEKIKSFGSNIYHVTPKKESLIKNIKEIGYIIKNGNYDVVHCHQNFSSFTSLFLAKKYGVPVRICHSHGCQPIIGIKKKIEVAVLRYLNYHFANYYFACGNEAGKWLYEKKWMKNDRCFVMSNAMDVNNFRFDDKIRKEYRDKYNINDEEKVLIHIGRFSNEKNHEFLIDIIESAPGCKLFLVGDGALRGKIEGEVSKRNLSDKVFFLGTRNDVNNLLSMADILLLPSYNEGLPLVTIEGQCNGINIIVSQFVPRDVMLTDLIVNKDIENLSEWISTIEEIDQNNKVRYEYNNVLQSSEYSIKNAIARYEKFIAKIFE